jgi:hypothetical protein
MNKRKRGRPRTDNPYPATLRSRNKRKRDAIRNAQDAIRNARAERQQLKEFLRDPEAMTSEAQAHWATLYPKATPPNRREFEFVLNDRPSRKLLAYMHRWGKRRNKKSVPK